MAPPLRLRPGSRPGPHRRQRAAGARLAAAAAAVVAIVGTSAVWFPGAGAGAGAGSNGIPAIAPDVIPGTTPPTLVAAQVGADPSVSGDGHYVVFTGAPGSAADQVVPDERTSSVWLSDRDTGAVTELTLPREGTRTGNSVHPVISADGCAIAVTTEIAYDLFRDDDRGARWDVYRMTAPACGGTMGDWSIVSTVADDAGQAEARNDVDPGQPATLSGAGSVVAYVRPFQAVAGSDEVAARSEAIDVVDLAIALDDPGHTVAAPGLPTEVADTAVDHRGQTQPALSADGSTLVFVSDATSAEAVPEWVLPTSTSAPVPTQVFAWTRDDADPFTAVELISAGISGPGDRGSADPAVSADGMNVAFSSTATNLVDANAVARCGAVCPAQVYVVDRGANDVVLDDRNDQAPRSTITLLSRTRTIEGQPVTIGNGASFAPSISGDGTSVAFATRASNLTDVEAQGGGEAADGDLLIADRAAANRLRRAFDSLTPAPGAHGHPHVSANGRVLIADSLAAGRLVGDAAVTGRHVVAITYQPDVSIATVDFGTITVAVPSPEWFANVVNLGPGSFTPAAVTIDNPAIAISGGSCVTDLAPVEAGASCSVKMTYIPEVAGPVEATLTVAEQGFGATAFTSRVRGTGGEPALDAAPDNAGYGTEVVGRVSQYTEVFQVTNVYVVPTAVASATMGGDNPDDFLVTASTCGSELARDASCPVEVSFRPTGAGRRTATLSFATAFGQYTSVMLSGIGVYAPVLLTATTVSPGDDLGVAGTGFPAATEVVLGWSDGSGRAVTTVTDAAGAFLTNLPTTRRQPAGVATVTAQAVDGTTATITVEVARGPRRATRRHP